MQRGSLLQPFAQQNSFCQGRLAARTGRLCSAVAALAGLSPAPARALTRRRASSDSFFLPCPDPQKRQTHPLDGFSSRRFLRKSLTPFSGESPASPRFPLGRSLRSAASPLFPKAVTVSCCSFVAAETAPAPCSNNQVGVGVSLQSRARRKPEPGLVLPHAAGNRVFRSIQTL